MMNSELLEDTEIVSRLNKIVSVDANLIWSTLEN